MKSIGEMEVGELGALICEHLRARGFDPVLTGGSVVSPTESVKDRLAAWYHWKDRQSLEQAVLVSEAHEIDLNGVARWSKLEGMGEEFEKISDRLGSAPGHAF